MTRLISHEHIEAESKNSVTYFIEIDRFRETCMGVKADDIFSSEKFFINWSEFSVGLYGGYEENDGFGGLRIFVTNHSDWMVKARMSISVGNSSSGLHMSSREKVLKSVAGRRKVSREFSRFVRLCPLLSLHHQRSSDSRRSSRDQS